MGNVMRLLSKVQDILSFGEIFSLSTSATRPQLVYDDECSFCTWAAKFTARRSNIELVGFSDLSANQQARLPPNYEVCAHLLTEDAVYSCGRAMEEALVQAYPALDSIFESAHDIPYYPMIREAVYHRISNHRGLIGRVLSSER